MLAAHLHKLNRGQPVRYAAMAPAHAAAIRNYLALTTRGYDVPGLYQQARPHLPGGREGELLHQLFSAMIGEHDPGALAQFLDAHQDFTGQPMPQPGMQGSWGVPGGRFLDTLAAMQHTLSGHPGFAFPGQHRPGYMGAFSPENLQHPELRQGIRGEYTRAPRQWHRSLSDIVADLHGMMQGGHPSLGIPAMPDRAAAMHAAHDSILSGHPHGLVQLNDIARQLGGDPSLNGFLGSVQDVQRDSGSMLRNQVIPHLFGQ